MQEEKATRREFLKGVSTPIVLSSGWFSDDDEEGFWASWFGDDEDGGDVTVYGGQSSEKGDVSPDGKGLYFAYDEDAWYKQTENDSGWKLSTIGGGTSSPWEVDAAGNLTPKDNEPISVDELLISSDPTTVESGDDLATELDAAGQGATVLVKSGSYTTADHYTPPADQTVIGVGDAVISPADTTTSESHFDISGGYTLRNLTFDGLDGSTNGVQALGAATVVDCEFKRYGSSRYPLNFYKASQFAVIGNRFHDNGAYGVAVTGDGIADGSDPDGWADSGIIAENRCWANNQEDIKLRGCRYCVVANNTIKITTTTNYGGIRLYRSDEPTKRNIITDNTIVDEVGTETPVPGIDVDGSNSTDSGKELITNNYIRNCNYGVRVQGPGPIVEGNQTVGSRYAGISSEGNATETRIISNDVFDGIDVKTPATVKSNYVGGGMSGYSDEGIFVRGTHTASVITGNTIEGVSGYGLRVGSNVTSAFLKDNEVKNAGSGAFFDGGTSTQNIDNYNWDGSTWSIV